MIPDTFEQDRTQIGSIDNGFIKQIRIVAFEMAAEALNMAISGTEASVYTVVRGEVEQTRDRMPRQRVTLVRIPRGNQDTQDFSEFWAAVRVIEADDKSLVYRSVRAIAETLRPELGWQLR